MTPQPRLAMTPEELARTLEREALCEKCKERPSIGTFDGWFVCGRCRVDLERKLVRRG